MRPRTLICVCFGALAAVASQAGSVSGTEPGKILLGPHSGYATIIDIARVDSDKAVVRFQRKLDDVIEDCSRNLPPAEDGSVPHAQIAKCAMGGLKADGVKILTRRAFCSRATLYTEFGNFSLIRHTKEEREYQGMRSRQVRTDWKDHKNEAIVGNCSACGAAQLIDTYRMLCPTWYWNAFADYDPY